MDNAFTDFLQDIIHDTAMSHWLIRLERLSDNERLVQISILTEKMRRANEDQDLINAVQSLTECKILNAAITVVREEG